MAEVVAMVGAAAVAGGRAHSDVIGARVAVNERRTVALTVVVTVLVVVVVVAVVVISVGGVGVVRKAGVAAVVTVISTVISTVVVTVISMMGGMPATIRGRMNAVREVKEVKGG